MPEITDREAAASFVRGPGPIFTANAMIEAGDIMMGRYDDSPLVQAFAAHRETAYQAGLLAGAKAMQWQPIETAPKDGTQILCFARPEIGPDYYSVAQWAEKDDAFPRSIAGWFWSYSTRPTHWMPLPEPPARIARDTSLSPDGV